MKRNWLSLKDRIYKVGVKSFDLFISVFASLLTVLFLFVVLVFTLTFE